jgi:hypothetical protein
MDSSRAGDAAGGGRQREETFDADELPADRTCPEVGFVRLREGGAQDCCVGPRLAQQRSDLGAFEGDRGSLGIVLVVGAGQSGGLDDVIEAARQRVDLVLQPRQLLADAGAQCAPLADREAGRDDQTVRTAPPRTSRPGKAPVCSPFS